MPKLSEDVDSYFKKRACENGNILLGTSNWERHSKKSKLLNLQSQKI